MSGSRSCYCWFRCLMSLIVLIANVAAPFRTPTGRSVLRCPRQSDTTRSVARVRIVSHSSAFHGFRAVVGFAKGNSGEATTTPDSRPFPVFLSSARVVNPVQLLDLTDTMLLPPLRC